MSMMTMTKTIKFGNRKIRLESNAYSLILYENTFSRKFLKDYDNVCGEGELDIVNYLRFLWTLAKTADCDIEDFEEFTNNIMLGDIFKVLPDIVELITANIRVNTAKKHQARITRVFTFLHSKFSHTQHAEV